MNILAQIAIICGIAMIAYAVYVIFSSGDSGEIARRKVAMNSQEQKLFSKEQKIQGLQNEIVTLSADLEKTKADYARLQNEFETTAKKAVELEAELTRRQDWVGKSEEMLNKVKEENLELKDKFIAKEKESQDVFTKNVDLNKAIRELNEKIKSWEKDAKEK